MDKLIDRTIKIVENNRYLTMATCSSKNVWIAPLAYVTDSDMSFIFYSAKDSKHIEDITDNVQVACSIYDSSLSSDDVDGIQFLATVEEIEEKDLSTILSLYFTKSFPDPEIRRKWERPFEDFVGDSIQRFYRIIPIKIYIIDLESVKVDRRVEVNIDLLKSYLKK